MWHMYFYEGWGTPIHLVARCPRGAQPQESTKRLHDSPPRSGSDPLSNTPVPQQRMIAPGSSQLAPEQVAPTGGHPCQPEAWVPQGPPSRTLHLSAKTSPRGGGEPPFQATSHELGDGGGIGPVPILSPAYCWSHVPTKEPAVHASGRTKGTTTRGRCP